MKRIYESGAPSIAEAVADGNGAGAAGVEGRARQAGAGLRRLSRVLYALVTIRGSSVVEQPAVNRLVVGSNPTRGAIAPRAPERVARAAL